MQFINYPKCSTCKSAKKFLENKNINFLSRDIVINNPTKEELSLWINKYDIPIKKIFNTSGILYKELKLKDKLPNLSLNEQIKILSENGMLVKRPLLIADDFILIGFKEKEWEEKLNQ